MNCVDNWNWSGFHLVSAAPQYLDTHKDGFSLTISYFIKFIHVDSHFEECLDELNSQIDSNVKCVLK